MVPEADTCRPLGKLRWLLAAATQVCNFAVGLHLTKEKVMRSEDPAQQAGTDPYMSDKLARPGG